jgi:diacylglycerol kinase family enzyme
MGVIAMKKTNTPHVAAIVGVDGCGKSATFHGVLAMLAARARVAGIGDQVWSGGPDEPLRERLDIPFSRGARTIGRRAKGLRWQNLYKNLKFLELTEQSHILTYLARQEAPEVILTDGQALVNAAAWSTARFYRKELSRDDEELWQVIRYLAGEQTMPMRALPHYLRRAWQLAAFNLLRLGRFTFPDMIFWLDIDPAVAMARICARGQPLQVHETEVFLAELGRAYARVCGLLQERRGIPVIRIPADQVSLAEAVQIVVEKVEEHIMNAQSGDVAERSHLIETGGGPTGQLGRDGIAIIATTMSGSLQDQAKIPLIAPEFRARTARPVEVHTADSHAEAQALAHAIVAGGDRLLVSAGGAGTFNAVLEGAHLDGAVPPDLRLAFLRKGSADLLGKVLSIPDQLPAAAQAIVEGIERDHTITADILALDATGPDGRPQRRHLVGFGGFGVFGEVPRISETRLIKYYKGFLGTLFGDLGPFYVAITLATGWWLSQHLLRRISPLTLTLDGKQLPPATWATVFVLNGDLGHEFPLGRDLSLSSGTFRVIALRYQGMRQALRQLIACRRATILDQPERYGAIVQTVSTLEVHPAGQRPFMVNVDGLRMIAQGPVHVWVAGQVKLVAGWKR